MAWIETVDEGSARSPLSEMYAEMVDPEHGRVDNILTIHGLHPEGLAVHYAMYRELMTSTKTLRKVDREMIAVIVSKINGCHY